MLKLDFFSLPIDGRKMSVQIFEITVFWGVMLCNLFEVSTRLRCVKCQKTYVYNHPCECKSHSLKIIHWRSTALLPTKLMHVLLSD